MKRESLRKLFSKVKLLVLDVDGVLTRGEIIYDNKGGELKIFNVKDGLGIFLLGKAGIKTVLLTAKDGSVVRRRAKDMGVAEVIGGMLPKEKMLGVLSKKYKVNNEEMCFIGDDLIDLGVIRDVGYKMGRSVIFPVYVEAGATVIVEGVVVDGGGAVESRSGMNADTIAAMAVDRVPINVDGGTSVEGGIDASAGVVVKGTSLYGHHGCSTTGRMEGDGVAAGVAYSCVGYHGCGGASPS